MQTYKKTNINFEVFPFTDDMGKYYALSDIVISRAGASTIFELAYFKRAAILIPYPFSAGQHQWKNASSVERLGGGYLIGNEEASGERLFEVIKHLMDEPDLLKKMGENIGKLYVADAVKLGTEFTFKSETSEHSTNAKALEYVWKYDWRTKKRKQVMVDEEYICA